MEMRSCTSTTIKAKGPHDIFWNQGQRVPGNDCVVSGVAVANEHARAGPLKDASNANANARPEEVPSTKTREPGHVQKGSIPKLYKALSGLWTPGAPRLGNNSYPAFANERTQLSIAHSFDSSPSQWRRTHAPTSRSLSQMT